VPLSPLLVLVGLAVWIASGRPILYRWQVVGLGGRPFSGYKFRTIVKDADKLKAGLLAHNKMTWPVFNGDSGSWGAKACSSELAAWALVDPVGCLG
jgi:lipopolysaccharide/colanic/teichoic acid biosynthesis glycosyltransferase